MDDGLIIVKQTVLHIIQTIRIISCGVNLQDKDKDGRRGRACPEPERHHVHQELKQEMSSSSSSYLVLQQQQRLLQRSRCCLATFVKGHDGLVHGNLVVFFVEVL